MARARLRPLGDPGQTGRELPRLRELRLAGHGIEGIAPDEVEAGWWVTEERRREGIAIEAMEAAIDDLWGRTDVEIITAYIEEGANEPSRRLAEPRIRGAGPRPRALGRADDGVRGSPRRLAPTRTLKPTGREWPGRACSHVTRLFRLLILAKRGVG